MTKTLLPLMAFTVFLAFGCAPTEPEATTSEPTQNSATPASTGDASATPTGTTVAMDSCQACGAEVPSDKLASHEGKMICEKCLAMHSDAEATVACTSCGTQMTTASAVMKDGKAYCEACAPK